MRFERVRAPTRIWYVVPAPASGVLSASARGHDTGVAVTVRRPPLAALRPPLRTLSLREEGRGRRQAREERAGTPGAALRGPVPPGKLLPCNCSVSWRDLCLLSGFRPELASVVTLAKSARPLRRWSNPAADWTGYYCCCCFRAAADMPSVGDQLLSSIMSSASRLLLVPGPSVIKKLDLDPSPPDIMEL